MKIGDLQHDPENRRTHTSRNIGMVVGALREVGAARSIVIDEDDVVLAGNGVVEAAETAGITNVRVIEADGQEIIAVRRRGLTPEQKRALAIYDNRTAELAAWDFNQLRADQAAGLDLEPFWTDLEQARLLGTGTEVEPSWGGMPAFEQGSLEPFRSIKVHFRDAAAVEAFAKLLGYEISDKAIWIWYPPEPRIAAIGKLEYRSQTVTAPDP